jgi:hypothetical protein
MSAAGSASAYAKFQELISLIDLSLIEIDKIPACLSKSEKNEKADDMMMNVFGKVFSGDNYSFMSIIDKFKASSEDEQDDEIIFQEYLALSQQEKLVVIQAMKLIVKIGILTEEDDIALRQKWLEKVMSVSV